MVVLVSRRVMRVRRSTSRDSLRVRREKFWSDVRESDRWWGGEEAAYQ